MNDKLILTILIVLIAMMIISLVMLIIINNNKLYCKYFSRKEWNLWEKVIEKLKEYKGTIISVSHDRKYINEVVNTLYRLEPKGLVKEI